MLTDILVGDRERIVLKQECIPVGCVLSAAVGVSWGGGDVCPGGVFPRQTPHPVDRILDTRLWKHFLSATTVADGNKLFFEDAWGNFFLPIRAQRIAIQWLSISDQLNWELWQILYELTSLLSLTLLSYDLLGNLWQLLFLNGRQLNSKHCWCHCTKFFCRECSLTLSALNLLSFSYEIQRDFNTALILQRDQSLGLWGADVGIFKLEPGINY